MVISRLNFRVGAVGASARAAQSKPMTLEQASRLVRQQGYSPTVEREILRELSSRPQGTYAAYLRNVQQRVRDVIKKLS